MKTMNSQSFKFEWPAPSHPKLRYYSPVFARHLDLVTHRHRPLTVCHSNFEPSGRQPTDTHSLFATNFGYSWKVFGVSLLTIAKPCSEKRTHKLLRPAMRGGKAQLPPTLTKCF